MVDYVADGDLFVSPVRTWGPRPNLFLFDPRPLWKFLRRGDFDLIDIHEEPFGLVMAEILLIKALRRNRTPFTVYSAQNLDKHYPFPFSLIERFALGHAAAAQVCNDAAGDRLRRRGLKGELAVLALGVDLGQLQPKDRPAPTGPLRVGYAGRLARHKGVHLILEAIAPLEGYVLEVVGDGPDREWLVERARALGIEDRVTFRGHAGQHELAGYYQDFDVVVVPSIPTTSWTEQFGRVVVEAMACGVPVISSSAGALPEVVGDAGAIFPSGDVTALRQEISALGQDPARWLALRAAGLVRASDYTWASVARNQLDLYNRILK